MHRVREIGHLLLAHLLLRGRHSTQMVVGGLYWGYCLHQSHRLRLSCWRWEWYDGYCGKHNGDCWGNCPTEKK